MAQAKQSTASTTNNDSLIHISQPEYGFFDIDECKALGKQYAEQYQSAAPFPHIYLDNFLPQDVANYLHDNFPTKQDDLSESHYRAQENLKTSFSPERLEDGRIRSLFYALNSRPFISFLEEMSGIEGLIPDPYFAGGGFHETKTGGHLGVHADFNIHTKLQLVRRLNILIYLNKDWDESWGGHLELWDKNMESCKAKVAPHFNRIAMFSTTSDSFHGHPDPLACPEDRTRRSLALYYYTSALDPAIKSHTTLFKPRPESGDKFDAKVFLKDTAKDWMPPVMHRVLRKLK